MKLGVQETILRRLNRLAGLPAGACYDGLCLSCGLRPPGPLCGECDVRRRALSRQYPAIGLGPAPSEHKPQPIKTRRAAPAAAYRPPYAEGDDDD